METIGTNASKLVHKNIQKKRPPLRRNKFIKNYKNKTGLSNSVSNDIGYELAKSMDYFNILFDMHSDWTVLSTVEDGIILNANSAFLKNTGYVEREVLGRSSIELGLWLEPNYRDSYIKRLVKYKKLSFVPLKVCLKNGEVHEFLASSQLIEIKDKKCMLSVAVDITTQKALEESLINQKNQLEECFEKIHNLETTVRVISNVWCREKTAIYKWIENSINLNIKPYIEKIKTSKDVQKIDNIIKDIEENTVDIVQAVSGFTSINMKTFTPSESQIIYLIRQGKSSKEIARILNVSTNAISFHRSNIRKKLNIVNKKTNLRTCLSSIDAV